MVTPLQSVGQITSQYLLNALKDIDAQSSAQARSQAGTERSALLKRYGVDTSSTSGSQTLATMLDGLSSRSEATEQAANPTTTAMSSDVTTASFMAGLNQELTDMAAEPATSKQAKAMLAALTAGTLTVTDPIAGVAVRAWDVEKDSDKTKDAGTKTDSVGWSQFLKTHLQRGDAGGFSRTAEGSYVDAVTGANAYFGTAGAGYTYLSWPSATALV